MRHDSLVGDQLFPRENRISLGPHWIQRAQSTMREEWTQHRNICFKKKELSGLNFLREVKKTSKKCKSETLNPVSAQGPLYHFTSNHANGLKWWFCSVPWESLKSRDPLGQGIQEVKTLFTTRNVTSMLNYVECTQEFSRDRICDIRTLMTNGTSHYDCVCLYFYVF